MQITEFMSQKAPISIFLIWGLFGSSNAFAQNTFTPAGTTVTNSFTLDYQVNSQSQTQIASDFDAFTVDRLVDLQVTSNGNLSDVLPGDTETLVYRLDNQGNDTFAFKLTATNQSGEASPEFDFTLTSTNYYADDGDGSYEPDADDGSAIPYGSYTNDLAQNGTYWVVIGGTIPTLVDDGAIAGVVLEAEAVEPTGWAVETGLTTTAGTSLSSDSDGNTLDGDAELVFADAAGETDSATDAKHSVAAQITASSADLAVTKTVTVMSTDLAGTYACSNFSVEAESGDQYSTPGACLEYVIAITNNGSASASLTAIADELPSGVKYIAAQAVSLTGGSFAALPTEGTVCNGTDNCTISYQNSTLAASASGSIEIRAEVK